MVHIAYIISAYRYPDQLVRLVRKLDSAGVSFFIHIDKKSKKEIHRRVQEDLRDMSNVHFLAPVVCHYFGFGVLKATIRGIEKIFSQGTQFDYAIYVTGQDYPIKSNVRIREELATGRGRSFLSHFPLPHEGWTGYGGLLRFEDWHVRFLRWYVRLGSHYEHFLSRADGPVGSSLNFRTRRKREFPSGFKPFAGYGYWCISAPHLRYVNDFVRKNRKFVDFFRFVSAPDEMFFQTVLMNSPFADEIVNDDLRYLDWSTGGPHPKTLERKDYPLLAESPKLFARKFDLTVDPAILDMIDANLLAPSVQTA